MKISALGYLGFKSEKYESWKSFGPEVLGVSLAKEGADGAIRLRMDDRHHRIAVHPGDKDEIVYIGWEVARREAFEERLEHFRRLGVNYIEASPEELESRRVCGMAWILDPHGFRHEIYYGQQTMTEPFIPGRPSSGFVAGELGIGHCVLVVPEVTQDLRDFATKVMGFHTYWPLGKTEIYRCNTRSHCLVYLPFEGRRGIDHFYMDLKSMDDVGRALDICRKSGSIARGLGRFIQDDDISFYIRTPTGVEIQYAWGSKLMPEGSVNAAVLGSPLVWGHEVHITGFGPTVHTL